MAFCCRQILLFHTLDYVVTSIGMFFQVLTSRITLKKCIRTNIASILITSDSIAAIFSKIVLIFHGIGQKNRILSEFSTENRQINCSFSANYSHTHYLSIKKIRFFKIANVEISIFKTECRSVKCDSMTLTVNRAERQMNAFNDKSCLDFLNLNSNQRCSFAAMKLSTENSGKNGNFSMPERYLIY